ncbi:S8 family serine peptidase [Flavisolibacter sp. BT320]|nr:S8 family serine peptidase [Flavisolibacter longurius]
MKKLLGCLLLLLAANSEAQTLNRYIIRFSNKATTPYTFSNPQAYLSQRAIERRTRYGIAIDSTDLPIPPRYLDSVQAAGAVTILNVSRWLNQVSIQTTDAAALAKIRALTFVENASPIAARRGEAGKTTQSSGTENPIPETKLFRQLADSFDYGASLPQVAIHNGQFLHNLGLRGQGMVIGMLDAGFFRYNTLRAFDSINQKGQVLGTYDFVARETSVSEDNSHGMQCLSVIAANIPSQFVGTAPKAAFYLFRTEDGASEFPIEEHNWVCAAERVDSSGGDVISSSLGYSDGMSQAQFNHTYAEMNGNTTIAAKGADLAAKKGILVVNAAGNQGAETFKYLATPADGDSVLAVGAATTTGQPGAFSSYGPSADGRVKPDVASVGVATVVQTTGNTIGTNNGTSFACPNMAGLATCLWQGFPEVNNMQIIRALRQAGSKAATPDDRVGYGIPDMKKAVLLLLKETATASVSASSCKNTITWSSKDMAGMRYEIERKVPGETTFTKIGEQASNRTVFGTQAYQFADSLVNIQAGTITYRVRQVIDTTTAGFTADYTDTVSVVLAATCTTTPVPNVPVVKEAYTLSPNPTQSNLTLRMFTPYAIAALTFRIIDSKGSILLVQKTNKIPGTVTFNLPVAHLAKGSYYLEIFKDNKRLATKEFIKL